MSPLSSPNSREWLVPITLPLPITSPESFSSSSWTHPKLSTSLDRLKKPVSASLKSLPMLVFPSKEEMMSFSVMKAAMMENANKVSPRIRLRKTRTATTAQLARTRRRMTKKSSRALLLTPRSKKPRLPLRLPRAASEPSINTQSVNLVENFSPSSSITSLKPTFENLITR